MRLTATGVTFRYPAGDRAVLSGVSLRVQSGERVALIGPSGSGKTTLLALLGGLLTPDEGVVRFGDGFDAPHGPADVAWVLQTVNVLPDRSVLDNVLLGALSTGADRRSGMVRALGALEQVGLTDRADSPIRVLSGGEVQRVVIARALGADHPVILADEPTGQLDAGTSSTVLDALFGPSHGRTVVVATHDPQVASRCDRVFAIIDAALYEREPPA